MSTAAVAAPSILCLPADLAPAPGFTPDLDPIDRAITGDTPRWLPRSEVEDDPAWLQVIPYVILRAAERPGLFAYPRGGSETRLHGRWSIGIGGHVERSDGAPYGTGHAAAIGRAMNRELVEEVGLAPWSWVEMRRTGLVYDPSSAVGAVHLGLVFECWVERPRVRAEGETAGGRWLTSAEVAAMKARLESWSRIVFNACYTPRGI